MSDTRIILRSLIEEGEEFKYRNFCSSWNKYGHPETYSEKWIIWLNRVETLIMSRFGEESVPFKTYREGTRYPLLGNEQKYFENTKSLILGALKGAELSLQDDSLQETNIKEVSPTGINITNKVFIVHGHNQEAKNELELFLREIGLEPIVLHRQPDEGKTIIEKFEKHSDVGYAFVILTPDEIAYTADQEKEEDASRKKEIRARPNVIFEFGYFVGKLGRNKVCCLHTGNVDLPGDLDGLVYKKFSTDVTEVNYKIIKELKAAGYNVQL